MAYQDVNARFAAAIHAELGSSDAPVFIQDYHLALVAPALRALRPDARTALFWHIPWPYPDRLRICPWRREILAGLLANDLLAFQLERDRQNFLLAAEEELGAEVEVEASRLRFEGRYTTVVSVPCAHHQSLRHRGIRRRDHQRDRHAARGARRTHASDAARGGRPQRVHVGVRHPRRS